MVEKVNISKYALTIREASQYFGIGEKKIRQMVRRDLRARYVIWNGNRSLIKRELFEKYLNDTNTI